MKAIQLLAAAMLLLTAPLSAYDTEDTRILRFADIHRDHVTFVYAGDIYIANHTTGNSQRLTDHVGYETFPKFSPNGEKIAFSAEYNGSRQIYVMKKDGSELRQLTYYNDVGPMPPRGGFDYRVLDWTPDGKHIVFRANRLPWGVRMGRPYLISVEGGLEQPLAVPETGGGMLSKDGTQYVYTPIDREFRTWKRSRGGRAQDVWIYDLQKNTSKQLTDHRATDHQPTVVGDDIYFVSDREFTLNLYQYREGKAPLKLTNHSDYDVLWPSAGPNAIVYENGGYLYRFDPKSSKSNKLTINIAGVRQYAEPYTKNVAKFIDSMSIDNQGKRALFTARGELFSVPKKTGRIRNLSYTPTAREIAASWSPNGRYIAYMNDATGEYEIYLKDRKNNNNIKQLTDNGNIWKFDPVWSHDNTKLLYADKNHNLWVLDIESGNQTKIDTAIYDENSLTNYVWSPNSKDIVYVKNNQNRLSSLFHYNIDQGKVSRLTDAMTDENDPSFSPDGKYLYFTSRRDFNLTFASYEFDYVFNNATRVYGVAVNDEVASINSFESDEVKIEEGKDKGKKGKKGKNKGKDKPDSDAKDSADTDVSEPDNLVQVSDFMERIEVLNAPAGDYFALQGVDNGVLAMSQDTLQLISKDSTKKMREVAKKINDYVVSANAKYLLVRSGSDYSIIEPKKAQKLKDSRLDLQQMNLKIHPHTEWQQMYVDGWRTLRDWFYDENHHGQDWDAIRMRYQPMAAAVAHRLDLDYVFSEIAGELNAGHIYVQSGDHPKADRKKHGLLGIDISVDPTGFIKIEKIFEGENWHEKFRSPLDEPGVKAKVGDYIVSVNGKMTNSSVNFYELLENTQGQQVELELSTSASTQDTWKVTVKPIAVEQGLRYIDWVKSRMAYVEKLSEGRIGYVHLPNTAFEGNREMFKTFMPQTTKEALIIDDRYNGGGFIPEHILTWLTRKPLNYWKRRGVEPTKTPQFAHDGPKSMLINGYSSSGGDAIPYYFREAGLGKLIGTRTWGGLIGISGNPSLLDGGQLIAATFRILDNEGNWIIENEGVEPDIEVIDRPEQIFKGNDPSIEVAVEQLLQELKANPKRTLTVPPAPSDF